MVPLTVEAKELDQTAKDLYLDSTWLIINVHFIQCVSYH